jgi:hypothetical protein
MISGEFVKIYTTLYVSKIRLKYGIKDDQNHFYKLLREKNMFWHMQEIWRESGFEFVIGNGY